MNFLKKYYAVLTGLVVFIIYLTTMAPTILQIDAGELTSVQALAGIAHPTGYPLFTMVGYLFSKIPLPFSTAYQLNILAAIWCSLGVMLFVSTSKFMLDNIDKYKFVKKTVQKNDKRARQKDNNKPVDKNKQLPEALIYAASVGGGLFLGLSKTFWFQSTSVEVYSMHIFLISLIIFVLVKAFTLPDETKKFSLKNKWIVLAIVLALGFSNHMTTLLILPGIAYFYFLKEKFNSASIKQLIIMLLIFFPLLIIIYSYLPIRASQNPAINWGNPVDFERIMRHVSGKQYQVWLFSSTAAAKKQLAYFFNNIPTEFTFTLLISLVGVFVSFFRARKLSIFLIITFVSTVAYSINYDINDIDSYFLLAYIMLAYFSVFGIIKIYELITLKGYKIQITAVVIFLFFAGEVFINYEEVNQCNTYTFEDYTKALISSTDKNSVVFSYLWDYFVSASYYFQYVEGFRKDVAIVDKELMRRSWYYHQLQTDHPGVIDSMQTDIKLFKDALVPFERSENFNSNLLESLYRKLMTELVSTNINRRSVYFPPEIAENELRNGQFKLPEGYSFVPDLLLYKIVKTTEYVPAADPDFHIRFPKEGNHYTDFVQSLAGSVLAARALYELHFNRTDRAKIYVDKIKSDFPKYTIPQNLRGL
jgi:Protein O-mannosyl-transferase TMEM260-like